MAKPRTLYDKIWDDHVVARGRGRHLPALHRPPSRPRGDQPAGLRGPAHDRPQGARAREDAGRGRPQRADHRPLASGIDDEESRIQVETLAKNAARIRRRVFQRARQAPGHRPHHRPRAGLHAARHDHRLRRQPHLDARRLRRAGARHRHVRGRACAGHPDADPEEGQEHAGRRSTASCPPASPPRTSSSPSSARSARPAAPAHVIEYRRRGDPRRCRWKAA